MHLISYPIYNICLGRSNKGKFLINKARKWVCDFCKRLVTIVMLHLIPRIDFWIARKFNETKHVSVCKMCSDLHVLTEVWMKNPMFYMKHVLLWNGKVCHLLASLLRNTSLQLILNRTLQIAKSIKKLFSIRRYFSFDTAIKYKLNFRKVKNEINKSLIYGKILRFCFASRKTDFTLRIRFFVCQYKKKEENTKEQNKQSTKKNANVKCPKTFIWETFFHPPQRRKHRKKNSCKKLHSVHLSKTILHTKYVWMANFIQ